MLLRFALLVGGTHKARIIANLLLLHFGLAALNHYMRTDVVVAQPAA